MKDYMLIYEPGIHEWILPLSFRMNPSVKRFAIYLAGKNLFQLGTLFAVKYSYYEEMNKLEHEIYTPIRKMGRSPF